MNLYSLIPNIQDVAMPPSVEFIDQISPAVVIFIVFAVVVVVMAIAVTVLLINNKKANEIKNASALYGPPPMFKKNKRKEEPIEDLYGCPRPNGMDEEPEEISKSED